MGGIRSQKKDDDGFLQEQEQHNNQLYKEQGTFKHKERKNNR